MKSVLQRIKALGDIDKFTESNVSVDELFPELKELKKNYQSIQKQKDDSKCVIYWFGILPMFYLISSFFKKYFFESGVRVGG